MPAERPLVVHDLGSGSGSMTRWLAPRLPGPQHWTLHDRDAELLDLAAAAAPVRASDGSPVRVDTQLGDVTRLAPGRLAGATLLTASALLDMLTSDELDRFVATCAGACCPVLITLSVTGQVELTPPDPFDGVVMDAFNADQRRVTAAGRLLGPDAAGIAVDAFEALGFAVEVAPSPWRLGPGQSALLTDWFTGWVDAASEQRPELAARISSYARRRLASAARGELSVVVQHQDLLARPS